MDKTGQSREKAWTNHQNSLVSADTDGKRLHLRCQVWHPEEVPKEDVNPRPLSEITPSNGLIGCFSQDGRWLYAMAFEPYQELFRGVAKCLHSDWRIGVVQPGESRKIRGKIRGKIYLLPNDVSLLLERYRRDFPEHAPR